jgi:DNA-binding NtrC family response regulator
MAEKAIGFTVSTMGEGEPRGSGFLGLSAAAEQVRAAIVRASRSDATVLISGESGVGKELVAREIHARSARVRGRFVAVNCAAIPDTLIESELFGHEAGAFTDAQARTHGPFELADRGTLFLDEVGDLSPFAQPKLLRAVETGEIWRVGSETPVQSDFRVIVATNHNLRAMSKDGSFRADLYYRLRIIQITVPALRHRIDDVPELARHFSESIARSSGREFRGISPEAIRALTSYSWPGNVRELRAVLENAFSMTSGPVLDVGALQVDPVSTSSSSGSLGQLLDKDWRTAKEQFEAAYAARLLKKHGANVTEAARAAGLVPRSLYKILHRLGLWPDPE